MWFYLYMPFKYVLLFLWMLTCIYYQRFTTICVTIRFCNSFTGRGSLFTLLYFKNKPTRNYRNRVSLQTGGDDECIVTRVFRSKANRDKSSYFPNITTAAFPMADHSSFLTQCSTTHYWYWILNPCKCVCFLFIRGKERKRHWRATFCTVETKTDLLDSNIIWK